MRLADKHALDSYEKRSRAAQIASGVNGVKGLVNNIQVAGTAPPPSSPPRLRGEQHVIRRRDRHGRLGRRVLRNDHAERRPRAPRHRPQRGVSADDRAGAQPGDRVLVRGATPATVRAPESRIGTVSRVDAAKRQLVLTDGSVVRVPSSASVHRGSEDLTLGQIEPGPEVVILLAPVPSASPGTSSRPADTTVGLDATDVSIVWTPSAATR